MSSDAADEAHRPLLRVVRGEPTAAELAALVAVVSSMSAAPAEAPVEVLSEWAKPERMARQPVFAGPPMSWWASSLPR
ncbi:MAG: acyl-CoA carboxylase subunit epsilon [Actinobacteria bacterium]|nr:acyl-CoA carboxylase subunit epsilon [Actinomycetota bacterium]MCB9413064.1 acyl-CoA carboxylase subunit epsilon [Actinomycetota bacterium]